MTAQELIEAAYARSAANDPGKLATDGEMIGVLNRLFQAYYAIRAVSSPQSAMARSALAALAGSPASASLPTDLIDIRRVQDANGAKVNLIPVEEIDRTWHFAPAIYRQGNSLFTRGALAGAFGALADPVAGAILTIFHLDAPATLSALSSALDARFPVRFGELLVVEMAIYLSTKDSDRNEKEFVALKDFRQTLQEMFLQTCGLSLTALQSPNGGEIISKVNAILSTASSRAA